MKNGTLIIDGKEYNVQLSEADVAEIEKPRTGYEREKDGKCFFATNYDEAISFPVTNDSRDDYHYNAADYYTDKELASGNARAETLMRRLRQWQALNDKPVDWQNYDGKWHIAYEYTDKKPVAKWMCSSRNIGGIYFSSEEKAQEAIEVFKDELIWYFTEYRQRLDEPARDEAE